MSPDLPPALRQGVENLLQGVGRSGLAARAGALSEGYRAGQGSNLVIRTPEDAAEAAETAEQLERALGRLTEEKRLVLLLFEREGLSGEEVARALDIPLGTVWTRLHHARADMRRALRGKT